MYCNDFIRGQMELKDSGKSGTQDTRERRELNMDGEKNIKVSQNTTQSYGSRAKSSFEEILKGTEDYYSKRNVRTNHEDNRSINPSEMQNRKPKNTSINEDSDVICTSKINCQVKNATKTQVEKELRSQQIVNDPRTTEECVKLRKKMLPRSASSAADSTASVLKLKWQDNDLAENVTKGTQNLLISEMNGGVNHIPMKLRRKSDVSNDNLSSKWMERPTDVEAPENDIILLKRWIENTKSYSVEENPLKSFKLKDEDISELREGNMLSRCSGGKAYNITPVLVSTPIDPYFEILEDDIKSCDGETDDQGKPHGSNVVITFANGDVFRGNVYHGKRCGYGIIKFATKQKISRFVQIFSGHNGINTNTSPKYDTFSYD